MVAAKTAVAIGHLVATRAPVQQHASLATTQKTAQPVMAARHTTQIVLHLVVAAMTAMHVRLVATMSANHAHLVTAKIAQHAQVLVVASATATALSALHTASQIHRVSKIAPQSAVGLKTVVVIQVAIQTAKSATQIAQTAQPAMTHASHHSVEHATQTQTRRLSSKTRFLSA
jgi:hypothetical protein